MVGLLVISRAREAQNLVPARAQPLTTRTGGLGLGVFWTRWIARAVNCLLSQP